jgi:hypothetical protein
MYIIILQNSCNPYFDASTIKFVHAWYRSIQHSADHLFGGNDDLKLFNYLFNDAVGSSDYIA